MGIIRNVIDIAFAIADYTLIGGILLSMVGMALRAPWLSNPLVQAVIRASNAICTPFRKLMQRLGLPTRPLDFSPMVAIMVFRAVRMLLLSLFGV
jgi:uncharacterized protein YggT (Ycf19 family)